MQVNLLGSILLVGVITVLAIIAAVAYAPETQIVTVSTVIIGFAATIITSLFKAAETQEQFKKKTEELKSEVAATNQNMDGKLERNHQQMNGKLEALIEAKNEAAYLRGIEDGKTRAKAEGLVAPAPAPVPVAPVTPAGPVAPVEMTIVGSELTLPVEIVKESKKPSQQ